MACTGSTLHESMISAPELLSYHAHSAMELQLSLQWGNQSLMKPWATLGLTLHAELLKVQISALWTQTASPGPPPGALWALWEHEVVECFIVGAEGHYLELEFGPYGHHLAIVLSSVRNAERWCVPMQIKCERIHQQNIFGLWRAEAHIARRYLPSLLSNSHQEGRQSFGYRINAFACCTISNQRHYFLAHPLHGDVPDFHQPNDFPFVKISDLENLKES